MNTKRRRTLRDSGLKKLIVPFKNEEISRTLRKKNQKINENSITWKISGAQKQLTKQTKRRSNVFTKES